MAGKGKPGPARPNKQPGGHAKCPKETPPIPKDPDEVLGQQKLFCDLLLADAELNATAAYQQAYPGVGYASARSCASYLLTRPNIRKYLDIRQEDRRKRLEIDQDYVLNNLLEVNERCLQRAPVMTGHGKERKQATEYVPDPETGEEVLANVWQFDATGACRANELIGKHLKMFSDRTEITGANGGPIQVADVSKRTDAELMEIINRPIQAQIGQASTIDVGANTARNAILAEKKSMDYTTNQPEEAK